MQRRVIVPAILVIGLSWSMKSSAGGYEMKDLEALEKAGSWQEALDHLGDIPPSKRNDAWNRIAEKSAAGVLVAYDPSKEETGRGWGGGGDPAEPRALVAADAMIKQYPTLAKSKVFLQARADAALKGFKVTYANSNHSQGDDPWDKQLKAFVASDTMTPDLALRAGKLVTSRLVAYVAIPYFKIAINGNTGARACKDPDVKKALVSGLADGHWVDDTKALVGGACYGDVHADVEGAFGKSSDDNLKKNACPIFAAHKASIAACK